MKTYLIVVGILGATILLLVATIASMTGGRLIVPSAGTDDRMCRDAVRDYLDAKGREYEIERWYPAESLRDRTYGADQGHGRDYAATLVDSAVGKSHKFGEDYVAISDTSPLMLTTEDQEQLRPWIRRWERASEGIELAKQKRDQQQQEHAQYQLQAGFPEQTEEPRPGDGMLHVTTEDMVDRAWRLEEWNAGSAERRKQRAKDEARFASNEAALWAMVENAEADTDDAWKAYENAVRKLVAQRRQTAPGWVIRVKCTYDEGFGRISREDNVFFVNADGKMTGCVPTLRLRLIEP